LNLASDIKDILMEEFQIVVDNYIDRNKNLLDTLSKYQMASSRLSRAIIKASTQCGCISLCGSKPEDGEPETNVQGDLCKNCHTVIEKEMGDVLFYVAAACNALDLSIYDVLLKEKKTLSLLGNYSLK